MATAPLSLFNTPQQYQQQQWLQAQEQAKALAEMSNQQRATYGAAMGGQLLGNALPSLLGVEDPELAKIKDIQGMFRGVDRNDYKSLESFAKALADKGYAAEAEQAWQRAQDVAAGAAGIAKDNAIAAKNKAEQGKIELSVQQEAKLREELARLGPNATEEDFLNVVRKYGNPNDVMKSIETRMQKEAALEEKKRAAEAALAAKLEEARMRGETAKEIARMQIEGRRDIAAMMAEVRREIAANKGPSPAQVKAQEKLDKKEEGKRSLTASLDRAEQIVEDLYKGGGITSSSDSTLSNLAVSAATSGVGQFIGRAAGTKNQDLRDEWDSVRLQLKNDVKEATGMTASELNSNVELQTFLKSLGSSGMTKEANLAIIKNIRDKYVNKGASSTPKPTNDAAAEWQKQWDALAPGQSLKGLDGKTYTKKGR